MRTILALSLALSLAAPAGAARADDAPLPAGWVRGDGIAPLPPRKAPSVLQDNHELTFPIRQAMGGMRHDVGALPVVEIEPSPAPAAPPAELPGDDGADEVAVQRSGDAYRVSLRGFNLGFVQVNGSSPAAVGPRSGGGAVGTCGPSKVVPLSYEGLRRADGGRIEIVWARGWFYRGRCRAAIVERHAARAVHLGGGVIYAFRTRCPACQEDAREALHVITPQTGDFFDHWSPFEHHILPLGPGRTAAFQGVTRRKLTWTNQVLSDWDDAIDRGCKKDDVFCLERVRVEVSQGRGEPAPTLIVSGDLDP